MRIIWDERKRLINLDKHGLDFATLTPEFFEHAVIARGKRERDIAVGWLDGVGWRTSRKGECYDQTV